MKNLATNFAPEGWQTITPRIVVSDAKEFIEFLKLVFDATGDYHPERPAIMTIGDSMIMISDAGIRPAMTAFLYVYVGDTDATYRHALDAGATSIEAPVETSYGD